MRARDPNAAGIRTATVDGNEAVASVAYRLPDQAGTIVLASSDRELSHLVSACLSALEPPRPRLTTVNNLPDCVVAVRLLDPNLVLLDDGIHASPGAQLVHDIRAAKPAVRLVCLAAQHSLDLERQVRREGVLLYVAHPRGNEVESSRLVDVLKRLMSRPAGSDA